MRSNSNRFAYVVGVLAALTAPAVTFAHDAETETETETESTKVTTSCVFLQSEEENKAELQRLELSIQDSTNSSDIRTKALAEKEELLAGCDDVHKQLIAEKTTTTKPKVDLAKMTTDTPWMTALEAGMQLAPTYDVDGQSSGFDEQSLYLAMKFDGRYGKKALKLSDDWKIPRVNRYGINVTFREAPIVNQAADAMAMDMNTDTNAENVMSMDDMQSSDLRQTLTGLTFNDVDDSVTVDAYASWQLGIGSTCFNNGHECTGFDGLFTSLGPFVAAGISTRSDLIAIHSGEDDPDDTPAMFQDDSVVSYYGFGLRFDVEDFTYHGNRNARNGIRRGYIQAGRYKIEDYAGVEDVWRWIIDAQYRLFTELPVFVGFHANLSRSDRNDTDDVAISVSYQFSAEDFLRRFTP